MSSLREPVLGFIRKTFAIHMIHNGIAIEIQLQRSLTIILTKPTSVFCRKPACIRHMLTVIQPYKFTSAIFNSSYQMSSNCFQFIDPRRIDDLVGQGMRRELNRGCKSGVFTTAQNCKAIRINVNLLKSKDLSQINYCLKCP